MSRTCWLALTHGSINRIHFKRPKDEQKWFEQLECEYGSVSQNFKVHIKRILELGYQQQFWPSLLASTMFVNHSQEVKQQFFTNTINKCNFVDYRRDILDTLRIYRDIYAFDSMLLQQNDLIPLYTEKPLDGRDLYFLSDQVKRKKTRNSSSPGTVETVQWTENVCFGVDFSPPERKRNREKSLKKIG